MQKKQIFIVGLDPFNLEKLNRLPESDYCDFLPALHVSEIRGVSEYDVPALIRLCEQRIEEHGTIDGIASYYDFPGTVIVPILAAKYQIPGPSLESILKCENKFWSRLEQSKVINEHIPLFKAFDPFDETAFADLGILPPFWIKPIKSFRSFLAFRINAEVQFYECVEEIKKHIGFIAEPFNEIMELYDMPAEFTSMKETCIAESLLTGHQCTLEGYVHDGRVVTYGIVDSIREGRSSSFTRYEYPSALPQEVQFRMADVTRRVIAQIELDNAPFNIEFFYDQTSDEVYLLEINPRVSQAHTDMFEKVHGISHLSIMVNLALGEKPKTLGYNGEFNKAANFMLRTYEPGQVKKVPMPEEVRLLKKFFPGLEVIIRVPEGIHLDELQGQDSYSYELANIFVGGRDQRELVEKYEKVLEGLTFDIEYDEKVHLH